MFNLLCFWHIRDIGEKALFHNSILIFNQSSQAIDSRQQIPTGFERAPQHQKAGQQKLLMGVLCDRCCTQNDENPFSSSLPKNHLNL